MAVTFSLISCFRFPSRSFLFVSSALMMAGWLTCSPTCYLSRMFSHFTRPLALFNSIAILSSYAPLSHPLPLPLFHAVKCIQLLLSEQYHLPLRTRTLKTSTHNHKPYEKLQSSAQCSEIFTSSHIVSLLVESLIKESASKVWSAVAQLQLPVSDCQWKQNNGERDRSSYSSCSLRTPPPPPHSPIHITKAEPRLCSDVCVCLCGPVEGSLL